MGAELQVLDGCLQWRRYVSIIRTYAVSVDTWGTPHVDRIMREIISANVIEVERRLRLLGGVVTKQDLPFKASTAKLWQAFDGLMQRRASHLPPERRGTFGLSEKAYFGYGGYATPYGPGRYLNPNYHTYDVHHVWPETLGGPTEGWNVVPLPKNVHLFTLHPILDDLVRRSAAGTHIRLL